MIKSLIDLLKEAEFSLSDGDLEGRKRKIAIAVSKYIDDVGVVTGTEISDALIVLFNVKKYNGSKLRQDHISPSKNLYFEQLGIKTKQVNDADHSYIRRNTPIEFSTELTFNGREEQRLNQSHFYYKDEKTLDDYLSKKLSIIAKSVIWKFSINPEE